MSLEVLSGYKNIASFSVYYYTRILDFFGQS